MQNDFSSPTLRVYRNEDVAGTELGGALKNVIALAAGIVAGLELGHNAAAALITRGIAEISRLSIACGGRRETMAGLSGIGDLVLTCSSNMSRNRTVGFELGRGRKLPEILASLNGKVAEGVLSTTAALGLAARYGVEMPITEQMAAILHQDRSPATPSTSSCPPRPHRIAAAQHRVLQANIILRPLQGVNKMSNRAQRLHRSLDIDPSHPGRRRHRLLPRSRPRRRTCHSSAARLAHLILPVPPYSSRGSPTVTTSSRPTCPASASPSSRPRVTTPTTSTSLSRTLEAFTDALNLRERYAMYIFDYGAPTGLRLAMWHPERVTAIVSQNGNAYEERVRPLLGSPSSVTGASPTLENSNAIRGALTAEGHASRVLHRHPQP